MIAGASTKCNATHKRGLACKNIHNWKFAPFVLEGGTCLKNVSDIFIHCDEPAEGFGSGQWSSWSQQRFPPAEGYFRQRWRTCIGHSESGISVMGPRPREMCKGPWFDLKPEGPKCSGNETDYDDYNYGLDYEASEDYSYPPYDSYESASYRSPKPLCMCNGSYLDTVFTVDENRRNDDFESPHEVNLPIRLDSTREAPESEESKIESFKGEFSDLTPGKTNNSSDEMADQPMKTVETDWSKTADGIETKLSNLKQKIEAIKSILDNPKEYSNRRSIERYVNFTISSFMQTTETFGSLESLDENLFIEKTKVDEIFEQMCGALKNYTLSADIKNTGHTLKLKTQCSFYGTRDSGKWGSKFYNQKDENSTTSDTIETDGYILKTLNNTQVSETISREEDNLIQEFNSSDPEFSEKIENFQTSFSPHFEQIKENSFDHQSSIEDFKSRVQRLRNQMRNG